MGVNRARSWASPNRGSASSTAVRCGRSVPSSSQNRHEATRTLHRCHISAETIGMMRGMRGGKHRVRRLSRRVIVLLVVLGLLVLGVAGTAFGALRYDHNRLGLILPGVRIDGIDVGNMDRAGAVA